VLLTTAQGQCIRFAVNDVRVFKGRDSMGVRGIALSKGDSVISLAILKSFDATPAERASYLKQRRALADETAEEAAEGEAEGDSGEPGGTLSGERSAAMQAAEQVILTVSENGFGKRTSSFEYRVTGRGGKGIVAMAVNDRNGSLVASFPVEESDEIMLVTNGGQLIRIPVSGIRVAGRATQGVILFDTAEGERVMSVDRIGETEAEEIEE
jgi:DNA gyrase subunit A